MISFKNIILIAAAISFIIVLGAAVYEHVAVVPRWKLAPPASLAMFQGPYGINTAAFWKPIHPVTLLLLIVALIANWKTARRKLLLIHLSGYLLVLIITFIYFVPELISFMTMPYQQTVDQALVERAYRWETLSLIRLFFIVGLAFTILLSLIKSALVTERAHSKKIALA